MLISQSNINELAWGKMNGMLPVIVQHYYSGAILMQGYMNQEALEKTLEGRLVTFYSRSKERLWTKGESSGNTLTLVRVCADCDFDSLIAFVAPAGPTCHTGADSCWFEDSQPELGFIADLENVIKERAKANPNESYTAQLMQKGIKRIAQKVGEEGVETALAAAVGDIDELKNESADLLFHLLVLLNASGVEFNEVMQTLKKRHSNAQQ